MLEIELTGQTLIIHMRGIYRVLALRGRVECALANVRAVAPDVAPALLALPLRSTHKVGTRLPGRLIIGSFGTRASGTNFYAIRTGERAITITLEHERYAALILEVEDPAGMASAIGVAAERAIADGGPADKPPPIRRET